MIYDVGTHAASGRAWIAAANAIEQAGGEAYNLILEIKDPLATDTLDTKILDRVDHFLRVHHNNPLSSVANTIFPQALLEQFGADGLYEAYNGKVFPRMKKMTGDWGRYFERLTAWRKNTGSTIETINPLEDLIAFMKRQIEGNRTHRHTYEMTIYDPARDAEKVSNRQCLSFLSFKLTPGNELLLTAVYRNHHYIARALGNFIGLGRLQAFVADQAGATRGALICHATHAEVDHHRSRKKGRWVGWTASEAKALLAEIRGISG